MSIQFAAVSLYDTPDAIQTKTIMTLAHFPERFAPPILGRQVKMSLGFTEGEEESLVIDFRSRNKRTFTTIVPEGPPMALNSVGTETRLVLHDTSKPWITMASDWQPKGLCPK